MLICNQSLQQKSASIYSASRTRRLEKFDEKCTLFMEHILPFEGNPNNIETERLICMTENGSTFGLSFADKQYIENFTRGSFVSGETELVLDRGAMLDLDSYEIVVSAAHTSLKKVKVERRRRKLAMTGQRTVLVVRVIATSKFESVSFFARSLFVISLFSRLE